MVNPRDLAGERRRRRRRRRMWSLGRATLPPLPPNWHTAMLSWAAKTSVDLLSWLGQSQRKRTADRLPNTGDITFLLLSIGAHDLGLQLGRPEVLRDLRNFLDMDMDRPEYHSTNHLKEKGEELLLVSNAQSTRTVISRR